MEKVRKLPILMLMLAGTAAYSQAPATADAQEDPSGHFRNARWYYSMDAVKKIETAQFREYRQKQMSIRIFSQPKPERVEHLYYEDTLLGKPVLVLYKFDLECKQLFEGQYIFNAILDINDVAKLAEAIEDKYDVELEPSNFEEGGTLWFARLSERRELHLNEEDQSQFYTKSTVIRYSRRIWEGMHDPTCNEKEAEYQELLKKL